MPFKALVLCSTAALTMFAQDAMAQTTSAPPAPTPATTGATPAAGATPGDSATVPGDSTVRPGTVAAAAAEDGDTIVVTGLRRSLQSAQTIKRNSDIIVDSVVAEDIGKLPDRTVSDTAARIVGVQVERGGGEASRVLVRGLPDFTTTYNGREIFTAEARSVALQDFPAGAIAALEVFKTTTANLVEGGLAGEVNVRSRKPFDFNGFEIGGSAWAQYSKRADRVTPNGNLLVTDRWETGIGEVGALLNVSYQQLRYLDSTRSNTDFVANPGIGPNNSQVLFPDIQRLTYGEGNRRRPSINGALQWRPADGLELYAEGLWQGFRNQVQDHELSVPLYDAASYQNIVLQPGTNTLQSLTAVNPRRPEGFQGATSQKTDTFQYAVGGSYDAGPLKITADVARTRSKFTNSIYSFDTAFAAPVTVNVNTNVGGSPGGPNFTFVNGPDVFDPATYIFRGFFDRRQIAKGDDWQARLDLSYETGLDWLPKLEVGGRYVDRNSAFIEGSRYADLQNNRTPLGAVPVDLHAGASGFPGSDPTTIESFLTPTYGSIRSNVEQLRALSGFTPGDPAADPSISFSGNERSYAGYGQLRYAFGSEDGLRLDGVIGVRVVQTKLGINGTLRLRQPDPDGAGPLPVPADVFQPISVDKKYTDWLPNISARLRFTDQLQLRLSGTETRTRPSFGQYNPGLAIDPPGVGVRNANGGNPDLNPLKSRNYDVSLEYYFSRAGSVSVAAFRRDLKGFIQNYTVAVNDPDFGPLNVNRPYNSGKGRIDGVEAQVTSFFDFAGLPTWLNSFGTSANITYLKAKTGSPDVFGGTAVAQQPLLGVSKWTYNLNGFYEKDGASIRLSYNLRSKYPSIRRQDDGRLYTESVLPISRLDLSMSYDLFKNVTLTADITNILAKPLRIREQAVFATGETPSFTRLVRYEESIYSAGVRFRF